MQTSVCAPVAVGFLAAVLLIGVPLTVSAQGRAAPVKVDPVIEEPLSQTSPVIGRIVSRRSGAVTAPVAGPIGAVAVQVGDRVRKGDPIASLVDDWLRLGRDEKGAAVRETRARLRVAQADAALASQELKRLRRLKKSAAFSQARFEDAERADERAHAEIARAAADLARAEAEAGVAEIDLRNAEIRAPFDGVVSRKFIDVGDYVSVGEDVIRLIDDNELEIEADVPFDLLAGAAIGRKVDFVLDDGSPHTAIVRAVVPEENPRTRTRAARMTPRFGALGGPLAVNQSAIIQLPIGGERQAVTVHKDAVISEKGARFVYVAANGKANFRPVRLGPAVGNRFEALDGLSVGDLAVVRGNEGLNPGMKDQPVLYRPPAKDQRAPDDPPPKELDGAQ